MNYDDGGCPNGCCFTSVCTYDDSNSIYNPRFRVIFSRGSMQFSVELSASDERNAVYQATKSFTKYVPHTELWGVFKVERV